MAQTRELAKDKKEDVKFCRCFEGKANKSADGLDMGNTEKREVRLLFSV